MVILVQINFCKVGKAYTCKFKGQAIKLTYGNIASCSTAAYSLPNWIWIEVGGPVNDWGYDMVALDEC